ncbi:MAG: hypothetical protein AB7N80_06180 [Bdellovibrionales bacterium]
MKSLGLGILFWATTASAGSFEGQTSFTAVPIQGDLHVVCQNGTQYESRFVTCTDVILDPFDHGYFTAEKDTGADEVVLTSQRTDGKTVEKKIGYDSTKGQSTRRVNLWIETLFQTALLDVGTNPVSYELRQDGQVKASGQFDATVTMAERKTCPRGFESSSSMDDCRFLDFMCTRYFRSYNWCM